MSDPGAKNRSDRLIDGVAIALIAVLFALPYVAPFTPVLWSRYPLPDLLIVGIVIARWRGNALERLGLAVGLRDGLASIALLGVGLVATGFLVDAIANDAGLELSGHRPFFSATQVFHQELVLRGLLLGALSRRMGSRLGLAIGVAMAFAALHPLNAWWQAGIVLPLETSISLFLFGFATNWVFLRSGHIGLSFAMHAAWNLQRFAANYRDVSTGRPLSEAQSFALIEGSGLAVLAGLLLVAVVIGIDHSIRRRSV